MIHYTCNACGNPATPVTMLTLQLEADTIYFQENMDTLHLCAVCRDGLPQALDWLGEQHPEASEQLPADPGPPPAHGGA